MSSHSERDLSLFSEFCRVLDIIQNSKGELKRTRLEKYTNAWRRRRGSDFYPAMRLLLPHLDKQRAHYGVKEANLAKIYAKVTGVGEKSKLGEQLLKWRVPGVAKNKTAGDFASVAFDIIEPRCTFIGHGSITIDEINNQLDLLNASSGMTEQEKVIRYFYTHCTPEEQKWLIRIILKELKIGITENSVFQVWHPDAVDLFNVCSSLQKVCEELQDPQQRLSSKDITLYQPFKPMLAKPVPIQDIVSLMQGDFWIEQKLDGERMQIHMKDGRFEYYSRKATDYTYLYGVNKEEGSLTPFIHDVFVPGVRSLILDGEMVTWDPTFEVILPFGTLKTAALDRDFDESKPRPCFAVFDVLMLNGQNFVNKPFSERYKVLTKIMTEKEGHLVIVGHKVATTNKELTDALDAAVMERQEGVIVKNPRSAYSPNMRNNDWIKVKPEYIDDIGDSLDLLVMGGDYGSGRRGGKLTSFFCGLRDLTAPGSEPRFLSFCKFGTGYTMEQHKEFEKYTKNWVKFDPLRCPSWAVFGREKPDIIIDDPKKSMVVQLRAAEITGPLNTFGANYTLRFPRFEKIREDKDWKTAMTLEEMVELRKVGAGRLQTKKVTEEGLVTTTRAKLRQANAQKKTRGTLHFLDHSPAATERKSALFENMNFCIMQQKSKKELQQMIKEHGGNFFQHPDATDDIYLICDSESLSVQNLIKQSKHDIIRSLWVVDCIKADKIIPLSPKYMLFATEETEREFREKMDEWGDSYTDEVTIENLKELLERMPPKPLRIDEAAFRQLIEDIETDFVTDGVEFPSSFHIFRKCVIYLDFPPAEVDLQFLENSRIDNFTMEQERLWAAQERCRDRLRFIEILLRYHGANLVDDPNTPNLTHVIYDPKDGKRASRLLIKYDRSPPKFVSATWVIECDKEGRFVDESRYILKS